MDGWDKFKSPPGIIGIYEEWTNSYWWLNGARQHNPSVHSWDVNVKCNEMDEEKEEKLLSEDKTVDIFFMDKKNISRKNSHSSDSFLTKVSNSSRWSTKKSDVWTDPVHEQALPIGNSSTVYDVSSGRHWSASLCRSPQGFAVNSTVFNQAGDTAGPFLKHSTQTFLKDVLLSLSVTNCIKEVGVKEWDDEGYGCGAGLFRLRCSPAGYQRPTREQK